MPVTVVVEGQSICHFASGGTGMSAAPSVNLTPSGPSMAPAPYPVTTDSSMILMGTLTVTADGGNPIAIQSSKFAICIGDATGVGGGVTSGTFASDGSWLSFSVTTQFEGKPVARHTDQLFMNKTNTVCIGWLQTPAPPGAGGGGDEEDEELNAVQLQLCVADAAGDDDEGAAAPRTFPLDEAES